MSYQFTPGPWTAGKSRTGYSVVLSNYHRGAIAKVNYGMADANLISAAPELLFVLEQIISDLPSNRDWLDPDIERLARDVIQKATSK